MLDANLISLIDFGRPDTDYSHMIQSFHRYLLDQLCSEGNAFPRNPRVVPMQPGSSATDTLAAAPITQLLGVISKNVITCSICKAVREKESMSHVVDLVHPRKVSVHLLFLV
jgi:PAB-dependent poly(A)-specific ribonuclease subunit 2